MKILAVGRDRQVSIDTLQKLSEDHLIDEAQHGVYDVLYIDLLHLGMDEEFEQVVDKIEAGILSVRKIVMFATAGIDQESEATWIEVQNLNELMLEMRYVAKLIDELEVPYTILRPVEIKTELQPNHFELHPEGQSIESKTVSEADVKTIIEKAILSDQYINQSVGISNRE